MLNTVSKCNIKILFIHIYLVFNKIRESLCKRFDICKDTKYGYEDKTCETILKPKQISQPLKQRLLLTEILGKSFQMKLKRKKRFI